MRAAIDGTTLYLLAEVTDDDVVGDADEVVLTLGRAPLEEPRNSGSGSYYCWINPMKFWGPAKVGRSAKPRLETQAVSGSRLNGYIMEIAVDITPAGRQPEGPAGPAVQVLLRRCGWQGALAEPHPSHLVRHERRPEQHPQRRPAGDPAGRPRDCRKGRGHPGGGGAVGTATAGLPQKA